MLRVNNKDTRPTPLASVSIVNIEQLNASNISGLKDGKKKKNGLVFLWSFNEETRNCLKWKLPWKNSSEKYEQENSNQIEI